MGYFEVSLFVFLECLMVYFGLVMGNWDFYQVIANWWDFFYLTCLLGFFL